jgi:hypothetical protein
MQLPCCFRLYKELSKQNLFIFDYLSSHIVSDLLLSGAVFAPTSQIRASAMSVLPDGEN